MNNLSDSFKKFIGNKNTVTIIGVVLCILILYFAYNYRINQQVQLVTVPFAKEEIPPKTLITKDMVGKMEVPTAFLQNATYYLNTENIIGKYSNINVTIPAGSIFYENFLVTPEKLPDALFKDVKKGHIITQFDVSLDSTYANSIMPKNIINIYFRAMGDDGKAIFGKFIENVEVLSVKDSSGNDVFGSAESTSPAYMFVALPEELFILVGKVSKIPSNQMEFVMVPNKVKYTDKDEEAVELSSEDIKNLINDKARMIDSNEVEEIVEETTNEDSGNNKIEEN